MLPFDVFEIISSFLQNNTALKRVCKGIYESCKRDDNSTYWYKEYKMTLNSAGTCVKSVSYKQLVKHYCNYINVKEYAHCALKLKRLGVLTDVKKDGKKLYIDDMLKVTPKELCILVDLEELYARFGKTILPKEIGLLHNLRVLHLGNSDLTSIPKEINMLTKLKELYLFGNKLKTFPIEICTLLNLRILNIHRNGYASIPDEISQLINLEELDIEGNKLLEFPISITKLKNLKWLDIARNLIRKLPDEIINMGGLEDLKISNNFLQYFDIPDKLMSFLKGLDNLDCSLDLGNRSVDKYSQRNYGQYYYYLSR